MLARARWVRGSNLSGKGRLQNVIFYVRISQIQDQKRTQLERPHWVYCTLSIYYMGGLYNISRRGLSRVAYPGQGMREPSRGMSECRAPTSFRLTFNCWIRGAIGTNLLAYGRILFWKQRRQDAEGLSQNWWVFGIIFPFDLQIDGCKTSNCFKRV